MSENNQNTFAPDRIIVKYKASQTHAARDYFTIADEPSEMCGVRIKSARILNPEPPEEFETVSLADKSSQGKLVLVELMESGSDAVAGAIAGFEASSDIEYAERDYKIELADIPYNTAPPDYCCPYGLRRINAPQAWEKTTGEKFLDY